MALKGNRIESDEEEEVDELASEEGSVVGSQDEEDEEEVDDEVMDDAIDDDEEEEVDEEEVEDYKPKSRRGRPPGSTNKKGKPAAKSSARTSARNSTRSGRQRSRSEEIDEISSGDEDMLDDDTETASASTSKKDKDEQRLTARQRAALNDGTSDTPELMSLDIGRQQKITLTEEEQALKKAEVLRRRKHQSDQRLENEKTETINRLLTKTASKRRGKKEKEDEEDETGSTQPVVDEKPETLLTYRWVSNRQGATLSVL